MTGRGGRIDVVLVVGGRWHDLDFARLELLRELAGYDQVRTRVFEDYRHVGALEPAQALISYTCDVRPQAQEQEALSRFVSRGGRWLALHGTNSAIDPPPVTGPRVFRTPSVLGQLPALLGSRFLAHPPIAPYLVSPTGDADPLVAGLEPFTTTDELYISELHPPLRVLLQARFAGPCPGFEDGGRAEAGGAWPVLYRKPTGSGEVCYLTLGHCRGRFDVQDLGIDDLGRIDRGSWALPQYRTLLARTLAWAVHGDRWPELADPELDGG